MPEQMLRGLPERPEDVPLLPCRGGHAEPTTLECPVCESREHVCAESHDAVYATPCQWCARYVRIVAARRASAKAPPEPSVDVLRGALGDVVRGLLSIRNKLRMPKRLLVESAEHEATALLESRAWDPLIYKWGEGAPPAEEERDA